ncbi:MAG: hypothetical protein WCX65_17835 [bacterium]
MNNNQIDADKIVRHINYTKHWLDKANTDFQDKNFASGSAVLNIARAELTAAWEEALQLKTELFRKAPRKMRANWKPAASVGLLAGGFMIALVITKFTPNNALVETSGPSAEPAIVLPQQPVEAPAAALVAPAESKVIETKKHTGHQAARHSAPQNAQETVELTAQTEIRQETAPAVPPSYIQPEPLPYSSIGHVAAEPKVQPAAQTSEINQADVIELFKTAESSLKK